MSLTMRRADWERLFADHPDAGYEDNDLSRYWMYDPARVALARFVVIWRREVTSPLFRLFGMTNV